MAICSIKYSPNPFSLIVTTSYESNQKSSGGPGKEGMVIFDEPETNSFSFRFLLLQGMSGLVLCVNA